MILVLDPSLDQDKEHIVLDRLHELGVNAQLVRTNKQSCIILKTDVEKMPSHQFKQIEGVVKVVRLGDGHPLASKPEAKTISIEVEKAQLGDVRIGHGNMPCVMAGPCSVEGLDQVLEIAQSVKESGATLLRGGVFKPRTSPYDFQGLAYEGLDFLAQARAKTGLPVISEVMSCKQVEIAQEHLDILQIGTRNMYNYELLKEVGKSSRPVLLKRGLSATIDEFLYAAEYILNEGNENVLLCERGIRTFETKLRNTLDLSAVPLLKSLSGLPVIVDPSHATGKANLVRPMSRAAIACGADGLLIEVHNDPKNSISDADQAISPEELSAIVSDVFAITFALNAKDGSFTLDGNDLVRSG